MKCGSCGRTIDDEFIMCPFCGADVDVETPDETLTHPVHPDVYPLLAQANLLKTRGDLAGSREKCAEALRKRPNDFDAQMMLGELYEAEGNPGQALTWYQMALDVRTAPDLAGRIEALKSEILRGEAETAVDSEDAVTSKPVGSRIQATVIIAGVTIVLLALVIGAGVRLRESRANRPGAGSPPSDMPTATNVRPQGPADPGVSPANTPSGGVVEGEGKAEAAPTLYGYTADEWALKEAVESGLGSHPSFSVSSVAIDPRTASVTVRLMTAISKDAQAERARIEQAASDVSLLVLSREPGCEIVTIEVAVQPSDTSASSLGFIGEMRRGQNAFGAPWFSPPLGGG